MHKQRKIIMAAAIAGMVATFLPWFTASASAFGVQASESHNGFHGAGIAYFLLMAVIAVIAYLGDNRHALEDTMRKAAIGGGIAALLCPLIAYYNIKSEMNGAFGMIHISIGIGWLLAFAAAIIAVIMAYKNRQDKHA